MAAPAPGAADFMPSQQPQPSPRAVAAAAAAAAGSKPAGSTAMGTPRASGQQAGHDEFVRSAQLGIYVDRRAPCCPRRQAGRGACNPAAAARSAASCRAAWCLSVAACTELCRTCSSVPSAGVLHLHRVCHLLHAAPGAWSLAHGALTGARAVRSVDEAAQEVERQAKAAGRGDLGTENLLRSVRELRRVRPPSQQWYSETEGAEVLDRIVSGLQPALAMQPCCSPSQSAASPAASGWLADVGDCTSLRRSWRTQQQRRGQRRSRARTTLCARPHCPCATGAARRGSRMGL